MIAITLWQPWASLIAAGVKSVETRSWAPPENVIGRRIAIHAAARRVENHLNLETIDALEDEFGGHWFQDIPRAAVVCTALLTGAYQVLTGRQDDIGCVDLGARVPGSYPDLCGIQTDAFGDYRQARWLWRLENIEPVNPPIPAKGKQGFWDWSVKDTPPEVPET